MNELFCWYGLVVPDFGYIYPCQPEYLWADGQAGVCSFVSPLSKHDEYNEYRQNNPKRSPFQLYLNHHSWVWILDRGCGYHVAPGSFEAIPILGVNKHWKPSIKLMNIKSRLFQQLWMGYSIMRTALVIEDVLNNCNSSWLSRRPIIVTTIELGYRSLPNYRNGARKSSLPSKITTGLEYHKGRLYGVRLSVKDRLCSYRDCFA